MFAGFDATTIAQLTANGIFRGAAYGLLGVGFALILGVTGRFHFAYSFTYTLAAYLAFTLRFRGPKLPFWIASLVGVLLAAAVGVLIERYVYRPLAQRAGATALLAVFVAALGIGIAGQNLIALFWGQDTKAFFGPEKKAWSIGSTRFENFDVWQTVSALALVLILTALLRYTGLGRAIKATRVNPELATIIGINSGVIYLVCFAIGTFFAGVVAFWYGLQFTVAPNMGERPVIFAFVVAFLAGTARSPIRVFFTGIGVALIEQLSSIWLSVRWTQTAVFVILVGYLVSLSLRGKKLADVFPFLRQQPATPAAAPSKTAKV
jgi:branched-subunit amino acid ABC-type transport system permease component